MKLHNKKTGEITTRIDVSESGEKFWVLGKKPCMYDTLAELNEEWEDYKPTEALIKDEKIRKAVRAWAEANDICRVIHYKTAVGVELLEINYEHPAEQKTAIEFNNYSGLEEGKEYTIAELCGEDE